MTKKKITKKPVAKKTMPVVVKTDARFSPWSLSIYVYWFIILFFIAATFYILGRGQEIIKHATPLAEESLMQPSEYFDAGKAALISGDIETAILDLTVASDSGDINAKILRGEAYMQQGAYDRAMDDFNAVISADSQNAVAFYDRALLYSRLENYNSALTDINNALAASAQRPTDILQLRDIYAKRGQLNLWLKNWDGAVADYTNSLARPEGVVNPNVYAERAEAFTALTKYSDAVADYGSAIRVISEQIQGATDASLREDLSRRAVLYFEKSAALNIRLNNLDAAKSDLQSALTIATALNDTDTVSRLGALIAEI